VIILTDTMKWLHTVLVLIISIVADVVSYIACYRDTHITQTRNNATLREYQLRLNMERPRAEVTAK